MCTLLDVHVDTENKSEQAANPERGGTLLARALIIDTA